MKHKIDEIEKQLKDEKKLKNVNKANVKHYNNLKTIIKKLQNELYFSKQQQNVQFGRDYLNNRNTPEKRLDSFFNEILRLGIMKDRDKEYFNCLINCFIEFRAKFSSEITYDFNGIEQNYQQLSAYSNEYSSFLENSKVWSVFNKYKYRIAILSEISGLKKVVFLFYELEMLEIINKNKNADLARNFFQKFSYNLLWVEFKNPINDDIIELKKFEIISDEKKYIEFMEKSKTLLIFEACLRDYYICEENQKNDMVIMKEALGHLDETIQSIIPQDNFKQLHKTIKSQRCQVALEHFCKVCDCLDRLSWNIDDKKCIRNKHGFRDPAHGNEENKNDGSMKIDFELIGFMKDNIVDENDVRLTFLINDKNYQNFMNDLKQLKMRVDAIVNGQNYTLNNLKIITGMANIYNTVKFLRLIINLLKQLKNTIKDEIDDKDIAVYVHNASYLLVQIGEYIKNIPKETKNKYILNNIQENIFKPISKFRDYIKLFDFSELNISQYKDFADMLFDNFNDHNSGMTNFIKYLESVIDKNIQTPNLRFISKFSCLAKMEEKIKQMHSITNNTQQHSNNAIANASNNSYYEKLRISIQELKKIYTELKESRDSIYKVLNNSFKEILLISRAEELSTIKLYKNLSSAIKNQNVFCVSSMNKILRRYFERVLDMSEIDNELKKLNNNPQAQVNQIILSNFLERLKESIRTDKTLDDIISEKMSLFFKGLSNTIQLISENVINNDRLKNELNDFKLKIKNDYKRLISSNYALYTFEKTIQKFMINVNEIDLNVDHESFPIAYVTQLDQLSKDLKDIYKNSIDDELITKLKRIVEQYCFIRLNFPHENNSVNENRNGIKLAYSYFIQLFNDVFNKPAFFIKIMIGMDHCSRFLKLIDYCLSIRNKIMHGFLNENESNELFSTIDQDKLKEFVDQIKILINRYTKTYIGYNFIIFDLVVEIDVQWDSDDEQIYEKILNIVDLIRKEKITDIEKYKDDINIFYDQRDTVKGHYFFKFNFYLKLIHAFIGLYYYLKDNDHEILKIVIEKICILLDKMESVIPHEQNIIKEFYELVKYDVYELFVRYYGLPAVLELIKNGFWNKIEISDELLIRTGGSYIQTYIDVHIEWYNFDYAESILNRLKYQKLSFEKRALNEWKKFEICYKRELIQNNLSFDTYIGFWNKFMEYFEEKLFSLTIWVKKDLSNVCENVSDFKELAQKFDNLEQKQDIKKVAIRFKNYFCKQLEYDRNNELEEKLEEVESFINELDTR